MAWPLGDWEFPISKLILTSNLVAIIVLFPLDS